MNVAITPGRLAEQLRTIGLSEGAVLLAHISYRAVRPVEGGPAGLIEGLRLAIGNAGTLVMPSWGEDDERPFDPALTPAATSASQPTSSGAFPGSAGASIRSPSPRLDHRRLQSLPTRCRSLRTGWRAPSAECSNWTDRFCSWERDTTRTPLSIWLRSSRPCPTAYPSTAPWFGTAGRFVSITGRATTAASASLWRTTGYGPAISSGKEEWGTLTRDWSGRATW
jgi:hypothetical protein